MPAIPKTLRYMDPLLEPDWRHRRVMELVRMRPRPGRCGLYDDDWVRRGRSIQIVYQNREDQASRRKLQFDDPEIFYAVRLHELGAGGCRADRDAELLVQARLLAGEDDEAIAATLGTTAGVIEAYAALFFDVRARLDIRDWIVTRVLIPAFMRTPDDDMAAVDDDEDAVATVSVPTLGRSFLDGSCKYFAYFGGSEILNALLGGTRTQLSANGLEPFLDQTFKRILRAKSIQAIGRVPVNRYNLRDLMEVHAQVMGLEKDVGGSGEQSAYLESMRQMLDALPLKVGDRAETWVKTTPIGRTYDKPYELSSGEMHLLASGDKRTVEMVDALDGQKNPFLTRQSTVIKEEARPHAKANAD